MLCDYVRHEKCGEHIHVDEWAEHVANPCGECHEVACDYPEPHDHGFACGPSCPCDMSTNRENRCICADTLAEGAEPRPCPQHGWMGEGADREVGSRDE